jgi:hypothetical protein
MDFLLDNSRFVRIKWLGRQTALSGKSMYLRTNRPRTQSTFAALRENGRNREGLFAFGAVSPGGGQARPLSELRSTSVIREFGSMGAASRRVD